ncbi:MAG TPA: hypothetical protein VNZ05_09805 [Solirubrobacteraceae bacterium]|jgi:hypothetical protein|nr:hypothetical protein [Solirubrobacteraceae bacterium]
MDARVRLLSLVGVALAVVALEGCGSSNKSASSAARPPAGTTPTVGAAPPSSGPTPRGGETVIASAGAITATMHAGTHRPKVGPPWPVQFTVTRAGKGLAAGLEYEFLFAGQVVAHRSHLNFRGSLSDNIEWPASAVGYPLTFRAVVTAGGARINLDYPVQVTR